MFTNKTEQSEYVVYIYGRRRLKLENVGEGREWKQNCVKDNYDKNVYNFKRRKTKW